MLPLLEWHEKQKTKCRKGNEKSEQENKMSLTEVITACTGYTEDERKTQVLQETQCHTVMNKFLNFNFPQELVQAVCPILYLFTTSCPLTSLINYRFIDTVIGILNSDTANTDKIKTELPEVAKLIDVACCHGFLPDISDLLNYVVHKISDIHSNDEPFAQTGTVLEEYKSRGARLCILLYTAWWACA